MNHDESGRDEHGPLVDPTVASFDSRAPAMFRRTYLQCLRKHVAEAVTRQKRSKIMGDKIMQGSIMNFIVP
jgi:hypothetical protein